MKHRHKQHHSTQTNHTRDVTMDQHKYGTAFHLFDIK